MRPTLRQIEIFVAVASALHFGRAAEALHITQATASQEVKRLEVALATTLLTRSTRSVALTPAGRALLEDARALLDAAARLEDRARVFRQEALRTVRVVASPSVIDELLPAVVERAETAGSNTRIEEVPVGTGEVVRGVLEHRGDIGVGRFLTAPPRFRLETLVEEEFVVALGADHPLARARSVRLADLHDLPLLLWPRATAPAYFDAIVDLCRRRGLEPTVLESPARIVGSHRHLLRASRAFAVMPRSAAEVLPEDITAVPLEVPAALPLQMIHREDDPRESVQETAALLRATARVLLAVGPDRQTRADRKASTSARGA